MSASDAREAKVCLVQYGVSRGGWALEKAVSPGGSDKIPSSSKSG